jgi:chemotaxis protein MotA
MDFATFVGIFSGLSLIFGAIVLGGSVLLFVNVPGLMIVVGGTVSATLVTFPLSEVLTAFKAMFVVFRDQGERPEDVVQLMVKLADVCRKKGVLALQEIKTDNMILRKACQLIADGSEEDLITNTLLIEIESLKSRHYISQEVFRKMGSFSPAFGMLGTLIGLVQMLSQLDDPSKIGPAMAVALLTTFYGSILSTMAFLPIAGKLRARTNREILVLEIIFEGAKSILESSNPIMVYEKLSSFLPPRVRRAGGRWTAAEEGGEG